jgi:tripartite-type tricarboxylate transporter receptor subunit TctC
MKLPRRQFLHLAGGAAALPAVSRAAWAQSYPTRPVRIIVPFAAGGPSDVIARLVAQKLTEILGKQFFVENQVGAGGNLAMGNAARAAPEARLEGLGLDVIANTQEEFAAEIKEEIEKWGKVIRAANIKPE